MLPPTMRFMPPRAVAAQRGRLRRPAPPHTPPGPSVADVLSHYRQPFLDHFGGTLSSPQSRALDAIPRCRTAELGGHSWQCHTCGGRHGSFNSCHNRNCATCSRARRGEWFARQCDYVLPVNYFHVVFTVPHQLNRLIEANPRVIYKSAVRRHRPRAEPAGGRFEAQFPGRPAAGFYHRAPQLGTGPVDPSA